MWDPGTWTPLLYRVCMSHVKYPLYLEDKTRQDKTRQDKTRQDKTRQDKTRQDKTRQDKTRQDKTRQDRDRDTDRDRYEKIHSTWLPCWVRSLEMTPPELSSAVLDMDSAFGCCSSGPSLVPALGSLGSITNRDFTVCFEVRSQWWLGR